MSSCPEGTLSIKEVVSKLAEDNFFMSTEYTSVEAVSTVKKYLDGLPVDVYRQTTDSFVLFKNGINAILVELSNGCSQIYLGMDTTALQSFLTAIGTTI